MSDGQLRCLSPPGLGTTLLPLEVSIDGGGHFTSDHVSYFSMAPVLSSVSPQSSPIAGGSLILLSGAHFGGTLAPRPLCMFGNAIVAATYAVSSGGAADALLCASPSAAAAGVAFDGKAVVVLSLDGTTFTWTFANFTFTGAIAVPPPPTPPIAIHPA